MRFWDTSALIPLVVDEPSSGQQRALLLEDGAIAVWWGTEVECVSAIERRLRDGSLDNAEGVRAYQQLAQLSAIWIEVSPSPRLKITAKRLLCSHVLRAADALQLASAANLAGEDTSSVPFVSLDQQLRLAAAREGFPVLP